MLAPVKTVFAQPAGGGPGNLPGPGDCLAPRYPKVARLLRDVGTDIHPNLAFPSGHWRSIRSTNAMDRVNAEIVRRAKVVGIFLNGAS